MGILGSQTFYCICYKCVARFVGDSWVSYLVTSVCCDDKDNYLRSKIKT